MGYTTPAGPGKSSPAPPSGDATANVFTANLGFTASGQRFLASTGAGIVYADNTILAHAQTVLGMTKNAGADPEVISEGYYVDGTMSWDISKPIWLSTSGQMTQVRPTTGFIMQVARAVSPGAILILPHLAIIMA